ADGAPGKEAGGTSEEAGDTGKKVADTGKKVADTSKKVADVSEEAADTGKEAGDTGGAAGLIQQVLAGGGREGAPARPRADGSRVAVQAQAVPLRDSAGAIDGIVVIARRAARRTSPRERDRIGLLERIGERLAGSLELNVTLRHVAETLVPQFADHC